MDSVSAMVLGVSMALERAPQAEWTQPAAVPEQAPWRQSEIERIEARRRKEWSRPAEAMRATMRRIG
jgi:hypothetical protein